MLAHYLFREAISFPCVYYPSNILFLNTREIFTTFTDTKVNNCFSIYHTSRITSGPESNFIWDNIRTTTILFFFGCSEVSSTWLITSELANQSARKVLFTCVVFNKLTSVFYASVLLLIMNFVDHIVKVVWIHDAIAEWIRRLLWQCTTIGCRRPRNE